LGEQDVRLLIALVGSGGLVAAAARCLIAFLKERKKTLSLKNRRGEIEVVATTFSAEELVRVLDGVGWRARQALPPGRHLMNETHRALEG
jgi:hypothetical protein